MPVVVIHGPMRSGKTLYRDRFVSHYGCNRVYDADDRGVEDHGQRDGDLILTTDTPAKIFKRFPAATIIPINVARAAIGLEPAPADGFLIASPDPRIKTAKGPTILLQSGSYFDLLDPHGSDFTIEDIAHGLSMTCRFAGQCRHFYSVAEHCWHASYIVERPFALRALMHDAAEAFIGDVTRPLKSLLPDYKAIERNIEAAIAARFDTGDWNVDKIKRADLAMLHAEQASMMPDHADRWSTSEGVDDLRRLAFGYFDPETAKARFLSRFEWLIANRDQA